jgi:flagellar protein FlgJ
MGVVPPVSAADGFLGKLAGVAQATAAALGLSPHLLLAQAALETGWGRKAIKDGAGQESYNLFGIKADKHWTGKTVEVRTTEYIRGVPQTKVESFRAYGSYAESFSDYARLIKHRYGEAIANGATAEGFGRALQAKGYATDPNYAQKIARVAQSVAYRLTPRLTGNSELGQG